MIEQQLNHFSFCARARVGQL